MKYFEKLFDTGQFWYFGINCFGSDYFGSIHFVSKFSDSKFRIDSFKVDTLVRDNSGTLESVALVEITLAASTLVESLSDSKFRIERFKVEISPGTNTLAASILKQEEILN